MLYDDLEWWESGSRGSGHTHTHIVMIITDLCCVCRNQRNIVKQLSSNFKNLAKEMYFSYCAEVCLLITNPPLLLQCTHILACSVLWGHRGQASSWFPRVYIEWSCSSPPWLSQLPNKYAQVCILSSCEIFSRPSITWSLPRKIRSASACAF